MVLKYVLVDVDSTEFIGDNDKEILMKLGFPLKDYLDKNVEDVLAYGEDIVCSVLLDVLIKDGYFEDFVVDKDYLLKEFVFFLRRILLIGVWSFSILLWVLFWKR